MNVWITTTTPNDAGLLIICSLCLPKVRPQLSQAVQLLICCTECSGRLAEKWCVRCSPSQGSLLLSFIRESVANNLLCPSSAHSERPEEMVALRGQSLENDLKSISAPFASLINSFFRFYTKILTYSRLISCFNISIFRNASVRKITFKIMNNRIHLGVSKSANR